MHEDMLLQTLRLSKSFLTDSAFMRFISSVNDAMLFQISTSRKTFLTYAALIRFHPSVGEHMLCQVLGSRKTFGANCALVQFLCNGILWFTSLSKILVTGVTL